MERKRKNGTICDLKNKKQLTHTPSNKKTGIDLVKHLIKNCDDKPLKIILYYCNRHILNTIIKHKYYDAIQYLLKYCTDHNNYVKIIVYIYYNICQMQHLDALKYLIELDIQMDNVINTYHYYEYLFKVNCSFGNLEAIQYIFEYCKKNNNRIEKYIYENGYTIACTNNNIDTVIYLSEYSEKNKYNINFQDCIDALSNEYNMCIEIEIIKYIMKYCERMNNKIYIYMSPSYFKKSIKLDTIHYLMYLYKHNYNTNKCCKK